MIEAVAAGLICVVAAKVIDLAVEEWRKRADKKRGAGRVSVL